MEHVHGLRAGIFCFVDRGDTISSGSQGAANEKPNLKSLIIKQKFQIELVSEQKSKLLF